MIRIDYHLLTITILVPTLLYFKSSKFYLTSSIPISLYLIGLKIPEPINLKTPLQLFLTRLSILGHLRNIKKPNS